MRALVSLICLCETRGTTEYSSMCAETKLVSLV